MNEMIDSLVHATPDGRWFHTTIDASESRLLREMDSAGIPKAVIVALAGSIPNAFVLDLSRRHAGRLIPGASINPAESASPAEAARRVRDELRDGPYSLLKLHPRFGRYDPLDPRCLAVLEEIASWKSPLPIWLDTLLYSRDFTLQKPPVDTLHEIVRRFPPLKFVLLHSAGPSALELAEAVRDCSNAWLDLSFTLRRYREASTWHDLRFLVSHLDRKTIWGSDFPEIGIAEALALFRELSRHLPSEKLANVLHRNLKQILERS